MSAFDGLSVVEALCAPHVQACRRGIVKPGPCPGPRKPRVRVGRRRAQAPPAAPARSQSAYPVTPAELFSADMKADFSPAVAKVLTGRYGNLSVSAIQAQPDDSPNKTVIYGEIIDGSGERVGGFERRLHRDPRTGAITAEHSILEIEPYFQGQGFAKAFNRHMLDWYRDGGVQRVTLHADIDVGGWAWAREGWDWDNPGASFAVRQRIDEVIALLRGQDPGRVWDDQRQTPRTGKLPEDRRQEQIAAAEAMAERMDSTPPDSPDYPTPYEISEIGRWEGQDPRSDQWHIGQVILMGSEWHAAIDLQDKKGLMASAGRVQACRRGIVKPGPCPGPRKPRVRIARGRRAQAPPAAPAQPTAKYPVDMYQLFEQDPKWGTLPAETVEGIQELFSGWFGNLYTGMVRVSTDGRDTTVKGDIFDQGGALAGEFMRTFKTDPDSGLFEAVHDRLTLMPNHQGQGFARAFNDHLFGWYRDNGVGQVSLHADIDVGGLAWARAGYDWKRRKDAQAVANRLEEVALRLRGQWHVPDDPRRLPYEIPQVGKIPDERLDEQIAAAEAMVERLRYDPFDSPDFPTPYEVSELGRWAGQDLRSDDWHIGQVALIGSSWYGKTRP